MDKEKLIPIIIQTVQDAVRKDKLGNSKVSLAKQDTFLIFYSKIEFFFFNSLVTIALENTGK